MRLIAFVKLLLLLPLLLGLQSCSTLKKWVGTAPSLTSSDLAIVANQADPLSMQIAQYYQQQRGIPARNLIVISFAPGRTSMSQGEFRRIKAQVDSQIPAHIQGFALTWAAPYRVECMSMTAAFAFGFDERFCASRCSQTQISPYFAQEYRTRPFDRFRIRPTMAIAAINFAQAKALIDRGIASDGTAPTGTAYLMHTSDQVRNVRSFFYPGIVDMLGSQFGISVIKADALENKPDVMFYFTGLTHVKKMETNQFRPGAIADHLTSVGGALTDSFQMSSLRWLEAGATGSYGTVVEPCNFPQKFPHPGIVMNAYFSGDTLLEAYWKSVAEPGQGIFIGEPLARPYSPALN